MPQPSGKVSPGREEFTPISPPTLSLPKGGGAIRGIGEKFSTNPVTGTGTLSLPIATSSGREGFGPQLSLSYDSGAGNGPFGFGWQLRVPEFSRKTDKGLPRYDDSDVFLLSDAEDLVPAGESFDRGSYRIQCFRPRIEGLFARIERWTDLGTGLTHWRTISRENATSIYGASHASRIADPDDPSRVFRWLITETYDDRGNVMVYEYKPEDASGVNTALPHEANRERSANRYLKRILYGNRRPHPALTDQEWLFEVVFDYGEHDADEPTPRENRDWPMRPDAFSSYRAGFEVRTCRLCRRVLMFNHFPEEEGVGRDCLVSSIDYAYREDPVASYLTSVTRAGWKRRPAGGFLRRSLPPLEFEYSMPELHEEVREIDATSLENLPYGLHDSDYRWVDLDGEGLSGILSEQGGGWLYKRNLGGGRLGPAEQVSPEPTLAALGRGGQQFLDLAGDGRLDLVLLGGPVAGFYERTDQAQWESFRAFTSLPNLRWDDPNLRFLDMDGDGHADILLTEDDAITWFPSLAEDGFGEAQRVPHTARLLFADAEESVYAADMSGDGLTDLVRIRNSEICYFPNLGRGRFGAKLTMTNSPWLDVPGQFDQSRVRLADIDGSGTADLIYLGAKGASIYFNQSGNRWSEPRRLRGFPPVDSVSSVATADLLGNGTACLVWSSALPGEGSRPLRYMDLMGGVKPHLLTLVKNNLGAETSLEYAPSTRFYLEDREAGRPWRTRLPFPVHVVERVETRDRISHNRFVTRYGYHDGFYDGVEREFRGFGMVEQQDTEVFAALAGEESANVDRTTHVPPVLTKTWFHTGAPQTGGEHDLPSDMTPGETRQAWRALKGSVLRKEIYALDGSPLEAKPYTVSERTYSLRMLQPQGKNRYAVFLKTDRDTLDSHYERNPHDPRVKHTLVIEVDDFGNPLKSVAVGYGRLNRDSSLTPADSAKQAETLVTYTEVSYTNPIDTEDSHRTPLDCETRHYQIVGLSPSKPGRFGTADFLQPANRRLIDRIRTYYRPDDFGAAKNDRTALLPLGVLEPLALPGEAYRLALTPEILKGYNRAGENLLPDVEKILGDDGGYVELDQDGSWWIPAGRLFYSPDPQATPEGESAHATQHFFTPQLYRDPFGAETSVVFDRYDLLKVETKDAAGNRLSVERNDYRVLQPSVLVDPNRNRSLAGYDALGLVAATAVQGKGGEHIGDSLDECDLDPAEAVIEAHLKDPLLAPDRLLGSASSRMIYDVRAYLRTQHERQPDPSVVYALTRETHVSDVPEGGQSRIQLKFSYSDGFGREIQRKAQADRVEGSPRWIGSGWTIFNNKGKPVRQYEPFFSTTHAFEFARTNGVSPIVFYDPVGRPVATLNPNHTYEKTVVVPWQQATWDVNDTVLLDTRADPDIAGYVHNYFKTVGSDWKTWHAERVDGSRGAAEQKAAAKTAKHGNTPGLTYFDTLGRAFLTAEDYGRGEVCLTRVELDINSQKLSVTDQLGRVTMRYRYDMTGNRIFESSIDAGERWMLPDIARKPIRVWDSRGNRLRNSYDILRRPAEVHLTEPSKSEVVATRVLYGEYVESPEAANLRGQVVRSYDQSGVAVNERYDFKGNLLTSTRQFARNYRSTLDWSQEVELEEEVFRSSLDYDALNRPITAIEPDNSVLRNSYGEGGLPERIEANLGGSAESTTFIKALGYNERSQRTLVEFGNGVISRFEYDPLTFQLVRLRTERSSEVLQDLHYTFDPVGNITQVHDEAKHPVYFRNSEVQPCSEYTYDALYRLVEATGREHLGQQKEPLPPRGRGNHVHRLHAPSDGKAFARYLEGYTYDAVGNLLSVKHKGASTSNPGWTRSYVYADGNNRLNSSSIGETTEQFEYAGPAGKHGNITRMPHLPVMEWDFRDQLQVTSQQVVRDGATPESTYYVYDITGQRVRKVTEHQADPGQSPTRKCERLYLGAFETFREYQNSGDSQPKLERQTLHVVHDRRSTVLVETRTTGEDDSPRQLARFQLADHLDSNRIELDGEAQIISLEEFYPFGGTSYHAVRSERETPKRYRYSGKERDEENGFYYYGARYYAPWLGRWTRPDPARLEDGLCPYAYVRNNPIRRLDPDGRQGYDTYEIGMGMMWQQMSREIEGLITGIFGGHAYVDVARNKVEYQGPTGGVGGMVGGVVRAGTVRLVPIEDNPTMTSLMGMEAGASLVPVLDPGARLVTGESVTGQEASRGWALVQFGLDVTPLALELHGMSVEARMASLSERGAGTSVGVAFKPGGIGPGHNMVGVNVGEGMVWSDLRIGEAQALSNERIIYGGTSHVDFHGAPSPEKYYIVEIPVAPEDAARALATAQAQVDASRAAGEAGIGPYQWFRQDCSTYTSSVLQSAGVSMPPVSTPAVNYAAVALRSPGVTAPLRMAARTTAVASAGAHLTQLEESMQMCLSEEHPARKELEEQLQMCIPDQQQSQ
jgi:RHS repeat-associated protein